MNKDIKPIIVIDSGIGGLNCAKNLFKNTSENIIYFADDLMMPYGNKSLKFLEKRLYEIITFFLEFYNPKAIVLACNTASFVYKNCLKNKFNIPINCVNPILKCTTNCVVLSKKMTNKLLKKEVKNNQIKLIACKDLASQIENNFFDKTHLQKLLEKMRLDNLSNIVLGCTHYELVKDLFEQKFPNSKIVSASDFCVDEIVKTLNKSNSKQKEIYFLCSSGKKSYSDKLRKIFFDHLT